MWTTTGTQLRWSPVSAAPSQSCTTPPLARVNVTAGSSGLVSRSGLPGWTTSATRRLQAVCPVAAREVKLMNEGATVDTHISASAGGRTGGNPPPSVDCVHHDSSFVGSRRLDARVRVDRRDAIRSSTPRRLAHNLARRRNEPDGGAWGFPSRGTPRKQRREGQSVMARVKTYALVKSMVFFGLLEIVTIGGAQWMS